MKEWKPHLYDISENSMLGNSIRDYDIMDKKKNIIL